MKNHLKTIQWSGQQSFIQRRGDGVWDEICDVCVKDIFTVGHLIDLLPSIKHLGHRTQRHYIKSVLMNVYAGQLKSSPVLIRKSAMFWQWAPGPFKL